MDTINAEGLDFRELNEAVTAIGGDCAIENVCGQRFLGSGLGKGKLEIYGTPGNALGAYLDGAEITVYGNAQDAVGDTMNDGAIVIHGDAGDALGYAMRGGRIFVKGNAGYRAGVHMKEYADKKPVVVIGGGAGSFLGEYLAGGVIVVLGLTDGTVLGNFTGTGMHGGKIFVAGDDLPPLLPEQVAVSELMPEDKKELFEYVNEYGTYFGVDCGTIKEKHFYVLRPNAANPYKRLYTQN